MPRPPGATNIKPFNERDEIPLSNRADLEFFRSEDSPLERFLKTIGHQENFLAWLAERHRRIVQLKDDLEQATAGQAASRQGAKDATYNKYMWHSERMALLDVINSFEYFYKESLIELTGILSDIIPSSQIKASVEGRFLWESRFGFSLPHLLFEHRLFHDPDEVNKATRMIVNGECYERMQQEGERRCIQAIFQVRHTLSHNCGQMTTSDSQKFNAIGMSTIPDGVIDPGKEDFAKSIYRYLTAEAKRFTECLRDKTIDYLNMHKNNGNPTLRNISKRRMEEMFGSHQGFDNLGLIL